jgi:hypothetical protein
MVESSTDRAERERAEDLAAIEERKAQVEADMDADEFVVVAPYATLKVRDQVGAFSFRGFNEGGGVKRDDIDPDNLRHHLESGLMAPVGSDLARFAAPAGSPKPGEPPNVPVADTPVSSLPLAERLKLQAAAADAEPEQARAGKPATYATKDKWVAYAVTQRPEDQSEDDAKAAAESMSKADLIATFGG